MKSRKKTLLVLSLSLVCLASCGGGNGGEGSKTGESTSGSSTTSTVPSGKTIQVFNEKSRLIGTPKPDPNNPAQTLPPTEENIQIGKLPTYHHKNKGDVPYVSLAELGKALGDALPNVITKRRIHL